ncbi:MAG: hypothetical protein IT460_16805 [Planctomycetes bacterium]|nr:hypothetical protein [Planctomycetota bacterium]
MASRSLRVLAVASGGGHWVQLLRLRPALRGAEVTWASVDRGSAGDVAPDRFVRVPDANRDRKLAVVRSALKVLWTLLRVRPDVVLTTGAAPGLLAVRLARLVGARTLFLDSVANADELSYSARLAQGHADAVWTQWPHLAQPPHVHFHGAVL